MLFSTCVNANDQSLGPGVQGCRGDFDFTVKFEQLFFSITPSAIFIVTSIWRTALLVRRPTIVGAPLLRLAKLGALAAYASLELSSLLSVALRSFDANNADLASCLLRLAAALCMIALSYFDHSRSPRPSIFLNSYLLLTLLLDIAQVRTYWLASSTRPEMAFTAIFTASLAMKVAILLLEAQRKAAWVEWDSKDHSPEETSGIYSLGVYFWLNRLFLEGYHKILEIPDLYPLDQNMAANRLSTRFTRHLSNARLKGRKIDIIKILARSLIVPLLLPIPARLALIAFRFCQPLFIDSLVSKLSEPESVFTQNLRNGYIGASIAIYTSIAISTALYWYFHQRALFMMRGILVTALYTKATEVRMSEEEENASLTLMSVDIERVMFGIGSLHEVWADLVQVAIASWLLYETLGVAFLAPIVIVLICSAGVAFTMRFIGDGQKRWMAGVQRRVGLTSSVIANMKNIKISGLTEPITRFVEKLRVEELQAGSSFRKLLLTSGTFAYIPLLIGPAITLAVAHQNLNAARIYTATSYLLLLGGPLSSLFELLPSFAAAITCLRRIEKFLESETQEDFRVWSTRLISEREKPDSDHHSDVPVISIQDGSFGWESNKMALNKINIDIPRGTFTMIVGPIASGKSSLCKAFLGEIPYSQGTVKMATQLPRVGYCDQAPFLSNGTIRDNIVGYSPFDAERYAKVVDATMLTVDFETLPRADNTNVGSNGITLSGGQKQRVSLARCLYLQTDLLIMDDVFSGLDADTEDQVFQRVFGVNGILKQRQTTIVLCTHSVRHLPGAGHVIALGSDGTVVEQGTFKDLLANQSYVHSLGIKSSSSSRAASDEIESENSGAPTSPDRLRRIPSTQSSIPESDSRSRIEGDRAAYKIYFKSMGISVAVALFFFGTCFGFFYNFPTVWLKYWSDDAVATNPSHSFGYYTGVYGALQACSMVALFFLALLLYITVINRSGLALHHGALQTLVHASLRFFTETDQGVITNLFSQDLNLIDNELPSSLLDTIFALFMALGQAAVIASSSPYLAISYPFLACVMYGIQKFYLRTSRQLRLLDLEAKSPLYTHFLDTAKGIVTLRAFRFLDEDCAKNAYLLDTSQRPAYLLIMIQQWLSLVLNVVVAIIGVLVTTLAVRLSSNSGFTGASLVSLMAFGVQLSGIVTHYTRLETSLGAISRLKAFDKAAKSENLDIEDIMPPEEWPQRGEITLNGVSASYATDDANETPNLALKNIQLHIQPGEKVAICGRTGSGKSSLIALLLKLLDATDATADAVHIDGAPLRRLDRATLRRRVIAIPQDVVFLPDGSSFRENLDPFLDAAADDANTESVLETVGLRALVSARGGLDAAMTAGTLSRGQRQLFSLARAVLRRRARARRLLGLGGAGSETGGVLLLDEVSSSVDRETERVMQGMIRAEFGAYTVVAVSHRLDMVMDYDRVVVMDKGEVVEVGNPAQLVADPGTRFGELWSLGGK
ncbi:ABC multidrug transporter [Hypoxylon sp. FL1284]|nr:ABC multidrug transporter [Hypoxylon sp. FL1284]